MAKWNKKSISAGGTSKAPFLDLSLPDHLGAAKKAAPGPTSLLYGIWT
jgi:hypothetical protein